MIEIPQYLINWALVGISSCLGWFVREMWDAQKKLAATIQALELKMVEQYVPNSDLLNLKADIFAVLRRIEDKLDQKANRDGR